MDELEKTMPDDFWRKTFEEASETPPPRVWDTIEQRLNESNGSRILPLWGGGLASSRLFGWSLGAAASVALVLIGWWLLRTPASQQPASVAQKTKLILPETASSTENFANKPTRTSPTPMDQAVAVNSKSAERLANAHTIRPGSTLSAGHQSAESPARAASVSTEPARAISRGVASAFSNQPSLSTPFSSFAPTAPSSLQPNRIESVSSIEKDRASMGKVSYSKSVTAVFEPVAGKSFRLHRSDQIQRVVWFRPAELPLTPESTKSKRKTREVWASAGILSGTFDPHVSLRTASQTASNYVALDAVKNTQMATQSSVTSRPNFSVGYQANVGMQLSDRWSVESGVGYLVGRSTIETPAQLPIASFLTASSRNSAVSLYTDALLNVASSNSYAANTASTAYLNSGSVYINPTQQMVSNDYQYVQVPVQVGYQLRPRKKLGLAVLGGFITNIFVKNTVDNEVVVTAKDGVYRPVSLAASIGARLRYRPSQQWSASLAGVYQPSLGLGTQADSQVQTRPTSAGMSFGVDYHF